MKRLIVFACVLALVLGFASTTLAAAISFKGDVSTEVKFVKPASGPFTTSGKMKLKVEASMGLGSEAGINLNYAFNGENKFDGRLGWGKMDLQVNQIWITVSGPFWKDGPAVTATFGDYKFEDAWREGFKLEGFSVGKFQASLFNACVADDLWASVLIYSLGDSKLKLSGVVKRGRGIFDNNMEIDTKLVMVPTDELTLRAEYFTKGADWNVSADVKASETIRLYGKIAKGNKYQVKATVDMDTMFDPTLQVEYNNGGAYSLRADGSYETLKGAVRYASDGAVNVVAGNGSIYDLAAGNITNIDKVDPWSGDGGIVGKTGYVGMLSKGSTSYARLATRFDLKTLVDLGVSKNTSLTARADIKANLTAGNANKAKFGVILGTKFSVGAFENVSFDFDVTTDVVNSTTSWGMSSGYTAPNGINFNASYGDSGTLEIKATKKVSF